jgi:hypothetical protein
MAGDRLRELVEEFRTVVVGRANLIDAIVPPLLFVVLNALFGFQSALWGALVVAALLALLRLIRRQPLRYALGGLGGVVLAVAIALLLDQAAGYFLPNIITGMATAILAAVSVMAGRPLVAWTSYLARRWPVKWYWHPRVRPAYSEVTLVWAVFIALRASFQLFLFQREATGLLGVLNVMMGWPATVLLLAASYLYGTWRLRKLGGPSVEEFKAEAPPPWDGQRRGF